MDKRLEEATAPQVKEPYERCTSNALRRECYRRKLRIIKSGPYVNATKHGYIQLLRASDSSGDGSRSETHAPRLITPPVSPASYHKVGSSASQTSTTTATATFEFPTARDDTLDDSLVQALENALPAAHLANASTETKKRMVETEEEEQVLRSRRAPSCRSEPTPRWERLHARLQIVDERLAALHTSLLAPAMTASDERRALLLADVAFY
ncbi:hypothetical protein PINS_up024373 [Pythium insidiosum]|nr:hypothetical protein PINS_up024373 [Pythium insidiosum]